ncbi:MAG: alpha/beta hydrolase [Bacteroidales bacterium]|nr:alpha/beta hydrolase [Bacteroidales bacterium]MBN2758211.1 alpha/beta hydrolase [Bacteroidales bacterium]
MDKIFRIENSDFRYKIEGQSEKVIVLLHGYLESLEVWNDFSSELSKKYKVIVPDLPGHGFSDVFLIENSIGKMADIVKYILVNESVNKCFVVGHSLGGYVALAFLEKYPEFLEAISLFHSSPFADSEEKKRNRDREIEIVKEGKKAQIYNNHFPKTFAEENIEKFKSKIEEMNDIAKNMSDEAIIQTLNSMKNRKDRTEILKYIKIPFIYIIGKKDNFISMDILEKLELPENSEIVVLEKSGHMGFIEEKEKSLEIINGFIDNKIR